MYSLNTHITLFSLKLTHPLYKDTKFDFFSPSTWAESAPVWCHTPRLHAFSGRQIWSALPWICSPMTCDLHHMVSEGVSDSCSRSTAQSHSIGNNMVKDTYVSTWISQTPFQSIKIYYNTYMYAFKFQLKVTIESLEYKTFSKSMK